MNQSNLPSVIIKDEAYNLLLEEIRNTEVEQDFYGRLIRIKMYYQIGTLIRDYQEQRGIGVTAFIEEIHKDLKYAERSLWVAYQMAKRWRTEDELMSELPDGKATSWKKVKMLITGEKPKDDDTLDLSKVARGLISRYGIDNAKEVARMVINHVEEA
jgi:hypothetical protein